MPAGEIQLVAYGEENLVLNNEPQITFFKITYRRYSNFSIETVESNFIYQPKFGKRYSLEIGKLGDLLHKMWLIIDLPDIPTPFTNNLLLDSKIKFKWAKKVAYALIDFVEIDIGGQIIDKQWGEWMNVLNELNWNNFNGSLDKYIGNTPDFNTYEFIKDGIKSKTLYIPLFFWFCNNSGLALPLLCLEYSVVRFYIQLKDLSNCSIVSPDSYISINSYYGQGILGEPLIQYSNQGIAWGEFDSLDINTSDPNFQVTTYQLYFRQISDYKFITTNSDYYSSLNLDQVLNIKTKINYLIYGLYSGSIFVPIPTTNTDINTINLVKIYNYLLPSLALKNMYLLIDYIFIDREERSNLYQNKQEYIIEQVYYSNPLYINNLSNKSYIQVINPCKFIIFMAQIQYFLNPNVNENFNYNLYFFDNNNINKNKKLGNNLFNQKSVINKVQFLINSNMITNLTDMNFYNFVEPFYNYPQTKVPSGFGLMPFSLYPDDLQPSGSLNMSAITNFEINYIFNPIDINYNKYIIKSFTVTYNYLRISNGIAATIFTNNY